MNTNGKEETKTITYKPETMEIIEELKIKDDYGFQVVKFKNNYYGLNYINPKQNINETVMISVDPNNNLGPTSFLLFAKTAYNTPDLKDADKIELVIVVDQKNQEIYRETINSNVAETLVEKMEIARELIELKNEDDFWIQHGTNILIICVLANIILAGINLLRLINGG